LKGKLVVTRIMANLKANFLEEMPTHTPKIYLYSHLNGRIVPSAEKAIAKEKKIATISHSRQGILHIKRDLLGNKQGQKLEECGIVNYSLCIGGFY
jgi:hypothetical protein